MCPLHPPSILSVLVSPPMGLHLMTPYHCRCPQWGRRPRWCQSRSSCLLQSPRSPGQTMHTLPFSAPATSPPPHCLLQRSPLDTLFWGRLGSLTRGANPLAGLWGCAAQGWLFVQEPHNLLILYLAWPDDQGKRCCHLVACVPQSPPHMAFTGIVVS